MLEGDRLPVWVEQGVLRLPEDSKSPIIMIGPGTGVAPFLAFAQELKARREKGKCLVASAAAAAAF